MYIISIYANGMLFPRIMWAHSEKFWRATTNACKSFHAKYNNSFSSCYPNSFTFSKYKRNLSLCTNLVFISSRKTPCLEIMKKVGVIIFPGSGRNSEQSPTVKCGQFGLFELENSGSGHNQNMSILRTIVNKLECTACADHLLSS